MTTEYPEAINQLARLIVASTNLRMGIDCYRMTIAEWERKVLEGSLPSDLSSDLSLFRQVRQEFDECGVFQQAYDEAAKTAVTWRDLASGTLAQQVIAIPGWRGSEAKRALQAAEQYDAVYGQMDPALLGGGYGRDLDPRRALMDEWREESAKKLLDAVTRGTRTPNDVLHMAAILGVDLPDLPQ